MTNLEEIEVRFDEKWQELGQKLGFVNSYSQKTRKITRWLIVSLALDILLTISLSFGYSQLHDTSRVVAHNSSRAVVSCRASNETRAANTELWNFVLSFPPPANQTPEQAKSTEAQIAKFKVFLNKSFAQRNCD